MDDLFKRDKKGRIVFQDELAEPIAVPVFNALVPITLSDYKPNARQSQIEAQRQEFLVKTWTRKMDLLARHFGYESATGHGYALAFTLALEFVPGFAIAGAAKRRRGRPRRTDNDADNSDYALADEVDRLRAARKMSIASACAHIAKSKGTWHGQNAKTLEARYHRLERTFVEFRRLLLRGPTPETPSLSILSPLPTKRLRPPATKPRTAKKKR